MSEVQTDDDKGSVQNGTLSILFIYWYPALMSSSLSADKKYESAYLCVQYIFTANYLIMLITEDFTYHTHNYSIVLKKNLSD